MLQPGLDKLDLQRIRLPISVLVKINR